MAGVIRPINTWKLMGYYVASIKKYVFGLRPVIVIVFMCLSPLTELTIGNVLNSHIDKYSNNHTVLCIFCCCYLLIIYLQTFY